ncbi:peptide ABC transporter substrate-binding protein (plasmid) [Nicoliella spurrieriana]|uniref:Peptide ABC transporter substrate-binding protein n=1 Tax=Nicoliella spurrieriana TaxID=2925830 RepID=A0A976X528_9LACO|nr:peptide ABC transporter substrate-binding protein [Nicoliella spurrieriana]UQS86191.1 peptide ABC transporter substrate-binding protein [Nicoliella spurrieriana]
MIRLAKHSLWKIGVVAALSSLVLAACGSNNSSSETNGSKKDLDWMSNASISTLDPSKAVDSVSDQIVYNAYRGLLTLDGGNKVAPGVATSYKVSNGGKTYTFYLRHSKWSNGTPVTAKDFVYGIQRSADPKTASQSAYYLDHIQNYNEVKNKTKPVSALGVKADGDYKLVINLSKPESYFKNLVTLPVFYPQSKAVVKKYGSAFGTESHKAVYNGPFKVTGWTGSNDGWNLTKNNYYWDESKTKVNNIKYNVIKDPTTGLNQYQAGKLDELQLTGKQQVEHFKNSNQLHLRNTDSVYYLALNQSKVPAFKNLDVRKAISLAIDRNQLTKDVLGDGSYPAKGIVPKGLASYKGKDFTDYSTNRSATTGNLAEAKRLWKKGLAETNTKKLSLQLLNDDTPTGKSVNEFLQSELSKLPGLKITNVNLPHPTKISRSLNNQFQILVGLWSPSVTDPTSPLNIKVSDNALNFGKWSNSEYDALMDRATGADANNEAKRWDDMVKANNILLSQQGVVPLYQQVQPEVIKSNIHGIKYYPNGPTWDLSQIYVK